ncbi:MAG: DEAD/DEAH box helicase [Planctomycetota bacterium]
MAADALLETSGSTGAATSRSAPGQSWGAYEANVPLIYVLDSNRQRERRSALVRIYQQSTGPLEGKLVPVRIRRMDVQRTADADDQALLAGIFGLDVEREANPRVAAPSSHRIDCWSFPLEVEFARELVHRLCDTGRFFVSDGARLAPPPIRWDGQAPWLLGLQLSAAELSTKLELRAFLTRDGVRRVVTGSMLLLERGVVIEHGVAASYDVCGQWSWLQKLIAAQGTLVYSASDEEQVIDALLKSMPPNLELPEPWRTLTQSPPIKPVLELSSLDTRDALVRDTLSCRVAFDYQGCRVLAPASEAAVYDRVQRVRFRRDAAAEREHIARLQSHQLLESSAIDGTAVQSFPRARLEDVITALAQDGWRVEWRAQTLSAGADVRLSVGSSSDWFELTGELICDGVAVSLQEVLCAVRAGERFVRLEEGKLAAIPEFWLQRFGLLQSWLTTTRGTQVRLRKSQGWLLDACLDGAAHRAVEIDEVYERFRDFLRRHARLEPHPDPPEFRGRLRDYQRSALAWFEFLRALQMGGCLADDMGLGKTVQVLALLEELRAQGKETRPSLLVCPKSLVYNWLAEAGRFTPLIGVLDLSGPEREMEQVATGGFRLVVTTYGVVRRDIERFRELDFCYVVLDEAQTIKNAGSQSARAVRLLRGEHRLALSGTPIENRVQDLWSICEFLNPGMLGSLRSLHRLVKRPAETTHGPRSGLDLLSSALRPFLLRRTKHQVANELPPKTEQTLFCDMEDEQRALYQQLLVHYRATALERAEHEGLASSRMHVLEALLRLRQVACHPGLVDPQMRGLPGAKLQTLMPLLEEVASEGHKALVFSQFTSYLAIVREQLERLGLPYEYLDGETRNRRDHVEHFQQDPNCRVFLISLKAGGLGLNLTAADYVYILDPWWNPAIEVQAIDRAHRIGQERHVFAYRLVCRDTVEERILELKERKRVLADAIISAEPAELSELTLEDLRQLFA